MQHIVWEIKYLSPPLVWRYCKKCKEKKAFLCSGQFRVNAQRKTLDVWLIYKCSDCDTTWNAALYSRVCTQSLDPALLEAFHTNSPALAEHYAMDCSLLQKNGAEITVPPYLVLGMDFLPDETVTLTIKSEYDIPIKISSIVRKKLHISQRDYLQRIADGRICSIPERDLRHCKLHREITLLFQTGL